MNVTLMVAGINPAFLAALFFAQANQIEIPPPPRGYSPTAAEVVYDGANVLSPDAVEQINRISFDVHGRARGEIAFVTLRDIGQRDPIDVGVQIARAWGLGAESQIGASDRNAGVLILIVPRETSTTGRGRCRILTGRGTEGFITDSESGDICREAVPLLQAQDYSAAAVLLTRRVAEKFAQEFGFSLDSALGPSPAREVIESPRGGRGGGLPPQVVFLIVVFILAMLSSGRRGRRGCLPLFIPFPIGGGGWHSGGGGWGGGGGGGFGGGFGGFGGGGGFSGGGGGSDW